MDTCPESSPLRKRNNKPVYYFTPLGFAMDTKNFIERMYNAEAFIEWLYGPEGGGMFKNGIHVSEWPKEWLADSWLHSGSVQRGIHVAEWAEGLRNIRKHGLLFWQVVTQVWSGFDRIEHRRFSKQFVRFASYAPQVECSPGGVLLYRGQDLRAPLGLSWTTCKNTAAGFARGHRGIRNPQPAIFTMTAKPKQVAFTCDDREESEYVLFKIPARDYRRVTFELLTPTEPV